MTAPYTRDTKIEDVMSDPVFGDSGRLLFPAQSGYFSGDTLEELRLVYYNNIDPDMTVRILNSLHDRAADGETIFYDIYTDEEKAADPDKRIPDCSSSKELRVKNSRSATPEERLHMSARCRTASRTRLNCRRMDITLLR